MTLSRTHTPHTIRYKGATYEKVARPFVSPTTAVLPQSGEKLPPAQQQELLLYSVQEWNKWYATVEEPANLQDAYLSHANLEGAYLQGTDLSHAILQDANLSGANLQGANLQGANLQGAMYNGRTQFPTNFDPTAAGMKKVR